MNILVGYSEPRSLVEGKESLTSKRHMFALLIVCVIFVIGLVCASDMGKLVPTYNGKVDVATLMEDPSAYDWEDADGAAYVIISENLEKTNADNVCFSVVFNFRGYDTMGESFILITALAGALCILRVPMTAEEEKKKQKKEKAEKAEAKERLRGITIAEAAAMDEEERRASEEQPKIHAMSIIVRYTANLFLPLACTFGGYVILHGDSSPGGGFQGGVLVASAVLLVFLAYGGKALGRVFRTDFMHQSETIAELIYVAIGLIGVAVGLNFAVNFVFDNLHIETALLMNHAVGYHVLAGVGCLLIMLLGMMNVPQDDSVFVENPDMEEELIYHQDSVEGVIDPEIAKAVMERQKAKRRALEIQAQSAAEDKNNSSENKEEKSS